VVVSSKNKQNQSAYRIYNSKDSAYWNADLQLITYNSGKDTIPLQRGVYEYNVELPAGTAAAPSLSARVFVAGCNFVITQASSLPGTAIIDVTAINPDVKKQYRINFSLMSGIHPDEPDMALPVVQNPFGKQINIKINPSERSLGSFDLFDANGRRVLSEEFGNIPGGAGILEICSDHLPPGFYSYRMTLNNQTVTGKLVKSE
jgi:hypothetical protein